MTETKQLSPLTAEDVAKASFAQHDPAGPPLPPVANLGDDGQHWVAYGHVGKADFREAFAAEWAYFDGNTPGDDERPGDDEIEHRYAIVTERNDANEWRIRWDTPDGPITGATPGSFPITVFTA